MHLMLHHHVVGAEWRSQKKCLTCDMTLRFHIFVKIGLDKGEPLLDAAFNVAASFSNISDNYLTC